MKVSNEWIHYAHGPAAEDGQPVAARLCDMTTGYTGSIDVTDIDLIEEIRSVAELYRNDSGVQDRENPLWWRSYPNRLIARCDAVLRTAIAKAKG